MKVSCIAATALALALGGCGLFDSGKLWSSGRYLVLWIDEPDQAHLAYRMDDGCALALSGPCVSAVAENAAYIAVELRAPQSSKGLRYQIFVKRMPTLRTPPATPLGEPMLQQVYEPLAQSLALPPLRALGEWNPCGGES